MTPQAAADGIASGMARQSGWTVAWAQLVGVHHRITEDSVAWRFTEQGLCLAVADGVGGGARGDIAAQALARHCVDVPGVLIDRPDDLARWMELAEAQVQRRLREATFSPGAATLAAAWLNANGKGHLLHVGDCRVYRLGATRLTQLTEDQTYAHTGETPPPGIPGDAPAHMVGTGCMGDPMPRHIATQPGDILLLSSDGLHKAIDSSTIQKTILTAGQTLETACTKLAHTAREAGSEDDISVLVAQRKAYPQNLRWPHWDDCCNRLQKYCKNWVNYDGY